LLPDIEIRVARFLDVAVSTVRDPNATLALPAYAGARLRRVRDIDDHRLAPAIHATLKIAAAVVRNLRDPREGPHQLPADGHAWREAVADSRAVTLTALLRDLWDRGIPVLPIEALPTPSFQGLAGVVEGRPVIALGHRHDEPGRVAFIVAHEAGHIAAGHCEPDRPVVDEQDEIADADALELWADDFARQVLLGPSPPELGTTDRDFRALAAEAIDRERETGAEASALLFSWARRSGDYGTATLAVRALYRAKGARKTMRTLFSEYVDLAGAPESDRSLMTCISGVNASG
jgi:hypothetical protein